MSSSSVPARVRGPVLIEALPGARVRDATVVLLQALLIAASAQLAFPLPGTPVLVTGQTFVVLLGAAVLGPGRAATGAALYGFAGLLGVPWFAVQGGSSLGYVAGFVLAGHLVGALARRGWTRTLVGATAAMVAGNLVIYAAGATVLALVLGLGPAGAVAVGVVPFLPGDAVKIAAAVALLPSLQRIADRAAPTA